MREIHASYVIVYKFTIVLLVRFLHHSISQLIIENISRKYTRGYTGLRIRHKLTFIYFSVCIFFLILKVQAYMYVSKTVTVYYMYIYKEF